MHCQQSTEQIPDVDWLVAFTVVAESVMYASENLLVHHLTEAHQNTCCLAL
jgi:hypothetical protein